MRNNQYYRVIISKRAAVKAVVDIADAVLFHGSTEMSAWGSYEGVLSPGRSDGAVYNLVERIKQYKRDAEKYYALQKLLKEAAE